MSVMTVQDYLADKEKEENEVSKFLESMASVFNNLTPDAFVDTAICVEFTGEIPDMGTVNYCQIYYPIRFTSMDAPAEGLAQFNAEMGLNLTSLRMISEIDYLTPAWGDTFIEFYNMYVGSDNNIYIDPDNFNFSIVSPSSGQPVDFAEGNVSTSTFTVKFFAKGELASLTPVDIDVPIEIITNPDNS